LITAAEEEAGRNLHCGHPIKFDVDPQIFDRLIHIRSFQGKQYPSD
jgi:hypothetical protein